MDERSESNLGEDVIRIVIGIVIGVVVCALAFGVYLYNNQAEPVVDNGRYEYYRFMHRSCMNFYGQYGMQPEEATTRCNSEISESYAGLGWYELPSEYYSYEDIAPAPAP